MNLDSEQIDALTEVVNVGVGRAAASLSELIGVRIELRVPSVRILDLGQLPHERELVQYTAITTVSQDFEGVVSGRGMLCFPESSGIKLARLLAQLDIEPDVMDVELTGILVEVGNIVLNGVLGTLSNLVRSRFLYTVPQYAHGESLRELLTGGKDRFGRACQVLIADTHFNVAARDISGSIMIVFELGGIERILQALLNSSVVPAETLV